MATEEDLREQDRGRLLLYLVSLASEAKDSGEKKMTGAVELPKKFMNQERSWKVEKPFELHAGNKIPDSNQRRRFVNKEYRTSRSFNSSSQL